MELSPTRHLEVTPINRQSYMAEISSLLGLITDEHTREVLIAKMERMFDAAEDEQKLINDIGSPTKVAVALIRYADNGVVTPEAAAVIESVTEDDPEQEAEFETLEALDEQPELLIPETKPAEAEEAPEAAAEAEEAPEAAEAEPVEAPEAEPVEAAPEAEREEALDLLEVLTGTPEEAEEVKAEALVDEPAVKAEPAPEAGGFSEAGDLAEPEADDFAKEEAPEAEPEVEEAPAAEPAPAEKAPEAKAAPEAETVPADADADVEALEEAPSGTGEAEAEDDEDDVPLTITKVNTFLAILYFIIPGLVIGLPVFLVLTVLNLAFLVVAAAVITAAVLLVLTGLTPISLPDRLVCFGAAAAAAAIGLVLLWFTIWFLICVTCGWVRLMTRGGKRISRKEVEIV